MPHAGRNSLWKGLPLLLIGLTTPVAAQPTDQAVKAAFLPKFARYISWPPAAQPEGSDPVQLCIVGTDTLGALLDRAAAGQSVGQHPIAVRRVASAEQAGNCHVAYVNGGSGRGTAAMLGSLRGKPVLTVTDAGASTTRGMIHFVMSGGRVRFYIDEAAAAASKLGIDSRLLGIALGVKQRRS